MVKNENVLVTAIEDFMALQSWEQKELGNQFGITVASGRQYIYNMQYQMRALLRNA